MSTNQVQTSGSEIQSTSKAFADGAETLKQQATTATQAKATPEKAGRKFHDKGQAYKEALDKLGKNIESFSTHGAKLGESFANTAKQYSASDATGADEVGKVEV